MPDDVPRGGGLQGLFALWSPGIPLSRQLLLVQRLRDPGFLRRLLHGVRRLLEVLQRARAGRLGG